MRNEGTGASSVRVDLSTLVLECSFPNLQEDLSASNNWHPFRRYAILEIVPRAWPVSDDALTISEPGWRNWQTQRTQNPPGFGPWGFDSPSRHQHSSGIPRTKTATLARNSDLL